MKIKTRVKDKVYEICCGSGIQDLAWLALTACHMYGKEAYPRGNYLPTLLTTADERIPHPRRRVSAALEDGEEVIIALRDLNGPQDEREQTWYQQAFGTLRNIMQSTFRYVPHIDFSKSTRPHSEIAVRFNYKIFEELRPEFPDHSQSSYQLEMEPENAQRKVFSISIPLPFGEISKIKVYEITHTNKDVSDRPDPRELNADEQLGVESFVVPEPWSKKQQKEILAAEEQEHRKKEEEAARKAQENLHTIDEAPTIPIKTIFDVWTDAPSALAPHFPLMYDIFALYANFHSPDDDMITAHDFFHMLRSFDLISDLEEIIQLVIELSYDLEGCLDDPLKQSISLTTFLQLLAKFNEWRNPDDKAFVNLVNTLAKSKAMWLRDDVKSEILKPEISELFMENESLLIDKYISKATPAQGHRIELKVLDFISMTLNIPTLREIVTADQLQTICADTLYFSSAKDSQMLYADFLETLVRLAQNVPFNEEEIAQTLGDQPETVILAEKVHSVIRVLCGEGTRTPSAASRRATASRGNRRPQA